MQDGETETENPFDIDVMKEDIPEELKEDDEGKESNRDGLDVSSDEEDRAGEVDMDQKNNEESQVGAGLKLFICLYSVLCMQ